MSRARVMAATLAASCALATAPARADLLVDDFSTDQAAGTDVVGPMLFGQRRLNGAPGFAAIAGGYFVQSAPFGAGLRYGAPGAVPSLVLDLSLLQRVEIDLGAGVNLPDVYVRIFSGDASFIGQLLNRGTTLAEPTTVSVGIAQMEFGGGTGFSWSQVTGLGLIMSSIDAGGGPLRLDRWQLIGSVSAVPEPPVWGLAGAGLLVLGRAIRRRTALTAPGC